MSKCVTRLRDIFQSGLIVRAFVERPDFDVFLDRLRNRLIREGFFCA